MFIEENLQFTKATQRRLENEMKEAERIGNLRLYKIAWSLLLLDQNHTRAEVAEIMHLFGDEVSFAQWGSLAKHGPPVAVSPKLKRQGNAKE